MRRAVAGCVPACRLWHGKTQRSASITTASHASCVSRTKRIAEQSTGPSHYAVAWFNRQIESFWVSDMGAIAVPACLREGMKPCLTNRVIWLFVLGNSLPTRGVRENPAAPNDLVVPTLLQGLADPNPRIQRSPSRRYVDDVRLACPALRQLLSARDFVQEQAVLALGTSGREAGITDRRAVFKTSFSKFRYSCFVCIEHNVSSSRRGCCPGASTK